MIVSPFDLAIEARKLWEKGLPPGHKTGWPSVDKLYTVAPGQLTIVTGWPGSGKSEWVDALAVNLIDRDWGFVAYSPENQPYEVHLAKLLEKIAGKPFGHGPTERMSVGDLAEATTKLEGRFAWIKPDAKRDILDLWSVLENATKFFELKGSEYRFRGLIIDPWNELEHLRPQGLSETEYISQSLTMLRNWARESEVHVWLIAHPQKLRRDDTGKLPIPRPDSISGSQHWWNKADVAITVNRDMGDKPIDDVEIHVWKVRFKHIGTPGMATLKYSRTTGQYRETSNVMDFPLQKNATQNF